MPLLRRWYVCPQFTLAVAFIGAWVGSSIGCWRLNTYYYADRAKIYMVFQWIRQWLPLHLAGLGSQAWFAAMDIPLLKLVVNLTLGRSSLLSYIRCWPCSFMEGSIHPSFKERLPGGVHGDCDQTQGHVEAFACRKACGPAHGFTAECASWPAQADDDRARLRAEHTCCRSGHLGQLGFFRRENVYRYDHTLTQMDPACWYTRVWASRLCGCRGS